MKYRIMDTDPDPRSEACQQFLKAYRRLCEEHNLCFSHEDEHGGFIVEPLQERRLRWVEDAMEAEEADLET